MNLEDFPFDEIAAQSNDHGELISKILQQFDKTGSLAYFHNALETRYIYNSKSPNGDCSLLLDIIKIYNEMDYELKVLFGSESDGTDGDHVNRVTCTLYYN